MTFDREVSKAFASGQLNDGQSQSNGETIFVLPLLHKECIKGSKKTSLQAVIVVSLVKG